MHIYQDLHALYNIHWNITSDAHAPSHRILHGARVQARYVSHILARDLEENAEWGGKGLGKRVKIEKHVRMKRLSKKS